MQQSDIVLGAKLRSLVDLGDIRSGSIGIVSQLAQKPYRFWLCWQVGGDKRYSLCFHADAFQHFELVNGDMSDGEVSVINYGLIEYRKPTRKGKYAGQLELPLSESEYFAIE